MIVINNFHYITSRLLAHQKLKCTHKKGYQQLGKLHSIKRMSKLLNALGDADQFHHNLASIHRITDSAPSNIKHVQEGAHHR